MDIKTAHKLLGSAGAHPTTRAGIDKRLEVIAAGKGGHKPTNAHPYRECFTGRAHDHYECDVDHHGQWYRRPIYSASYGARLSCVEYIAAVQASKLEATA